MAQWPAIRTQTSPSPTAQRLRVHRHIHPHLRTLPLNPNGTRGHSPPPARAFRLGLGGSGVVTHLTRVGGHAAFPYGRLEVTFHHRNPLLPFDSLSCSFRGHCGVCWLLSLLVEFCQLNLKSTTWSTRLTSPAFLGLNWLLILRQKQKTRQTLERRSPPYTFKCPLNPNPSLVFFSSR